MQTRVTSRASMRVDVRSVNKALHYRVVFGSNRKSARYIAAWFIAIISGFSFFGNRF